VLRVEVHDLAENRFSVLCRRGQRRSGVGGCEEAGDEALLSLQERKVRMEDQEEEKEDAPSSASRRGGGRSDGRSAVKGGHRGRVGSVEGSSCGENGEEWKMTECGGEREENRRNCFSSFACQRRKRRVILPYLHRPRKPDSPDVHRTLRRKKTRKSDSTFRA
jgi:hypothetical protein